MTTQFINASSLVSRLIEANKNEIEQEEKALDNEGKLIDKQFDEIGRRQVQHSLRRVAHNNKAAAFNHLNLAAKLMNTSGKDDPVPADSSTAQLISEVCNILGIDEKTIRAAVFVG